MLLAWFLWFCLHFVEMLIMRRSLPVVTAQKKEQNLWLLTGWPSAFRIIYKNFKLSCACVKSRRSIQRGQVTGHQDFLIDLIDKATVTKINWSWRPAFSTRVYRHAHDTFYETRDELSRHHSDVLFRVTSSIAQYMKWMYWYQSHLVLTASK